MRWKTFKTTLKTKPPKRQQMDTEMEMRKPERGNALRTARAYNDRQGYSGSGCNITRETGGTAVGERAAGLPSDNQACGGCDTRLAPHYPLAAPQGSAGCSRCSASCDRAVAKQGTRSGRNSVRCWCSCRLRSRDGSSAVAPDRDLAFCDAVLPAVVENIIS